MDTDRFEHIVNENKELRDMYLGELIQYTHKLHKQIAKQDDHSFWRKFKEQAFNALGTDPSSIVYWLIGFPVTIIILGWMCVSMTTYTVSHITRTFRGEEIITTRKIIGYALSQDRDNNGNYCMTIQTIKDNFSAIESDCIKDTQTALSAIKELEQIRLGTQLIPEEEPPYFLRREPLTND